jgi:plasmid stabilization system protein ParE
MPALKRHPLVRVDLQAAYDWYEDQLPGLGNRFQEDFQLAYQRLRQGPQLYAVRFSGIRRVNLRRFPFGIFYTMAPGEIRILAVLHGSRETKNILTKRHRTFFGNPF